MSINFRDLAESDHSLTEVLFLSVKGNKPPKLSENFVLIIISKRLDWIPENIVSFENFS